MLITNSTSNNPTYQQPQEQTKTEAIALKIIYTTPWNHQVVQLTNKKICLQNVPFLRQAAPYSCGAATTTEILCYFGDGDFEQSIGEKIFTKDGTNHLAMLRFLKEQGYLLEEKTDLSSEDLKQLLDNKQVMMFFSQGWDDAPPQDYTNFWGLGHVMIPIGYCDQGFLFRDSFPLNGVSLIPYSRLSEFWHYQSYETNPDVDPTKYPGYAVVISKKETTPLFDHPLRQEADAATLLK